MELELTIRFRNVEELQEVISKLKSQVIPPPTATVVSEGVSSTVKVISEDVPNEQVHATCEYCKKEFVPTRNSQRTCSKKCYMADYWSKHRKGPDGKIELKDNMPEVKKKK
jgi:hypothetical protein